MLNFLRRSRILAFNQIDRDTWVAEQAGRIPAGSRVLDVGAGSCPYRELFSHCTYQSQDAEILNREQLLGKAGYGQIDFRCDSTRIPVADGSYDAVLCTEVLEHVPDPVGVVNETGRVLRPGGTLILSAPLGSGLHQEPYHFYGGYTPYWYRKFLGAAGFVDVEISPNGNFYKLFSQEAIRFVRKSNPISSGWPILYRVLWAPFWLLVLPLMAGVLPVICHAVDAYDRPVAFTVGYHVTARKAGVPG